MFDLATQTARRPLEERSLRSRVAAILAHAAGFLVLIAIPVSHVVKEDLETPPIEAFVVPPDKLPPMPTAPPAPAAAPAPVRHEESQQLARPEEGTTPIEAPAAIAPEPASALQPDSVVGTIGGVEGGVAGGVIGGVVGGLGTALPPPPPPAPARPRAPVRVSGAIKTPDLLRRVEPVYSVIAATSRISGVVILEAVVDESGSVQAVKILRGRSPFLDKAAEEALKQWKYAPLMLAGVATPFEVTVTFNFSIPAA